MAVPVTQPADSDARGQARVLPFVVPSPSDAVLVVRARGGDLEAFGTLLGRHQERFLRYARNMLGSREDAEEAVQDALVRAHRALDRCDPDRFGAWAFRILVNRCRSAARRRRWWKLFRADLDQALEVEGGTAPVESPWREEIDRAIGRLSSEQREAFVLKHVDELTYEEMSEMTGASIPALKMRVSRACERLRKSLEGAT